MKALISALLMTAVMVSSVTAEEGRYESHGRRDPFIPLVGLDSPAVTRLEDVTSISDIRLEGIAMGAALRRSAILNGEVLKENDRVGDVWLKKVDEKSVTVFIGGKAYDLYLSGEEGGPEGEKRPK